MAERQRAPRRDQGLPEGGGSSGVAQFDCLRPSHKTLEWTLSSTKLADLTNGLEVASLKQHANEDVGIGMSAALRRAKEPNRITFSGVKWATSRSVKASSA